MKLAALTVDVEDGVNLGMRDLLGKEILPTERVLSNTQKVLELFELNDAKGTFFVLGQVAEHYPQLIKEIHEAGHEIGVHGYDHYQFFRMDYDMAKDQLSRARKLLQDLTGQPILGHRAPAFSINQKTAWGLELLAELGFQYDSSVMPCRSMNYGWEGFNKNLTCIEFESGRELYEFPMSVISILGREVPGLGGSYLRLLPISQTLKTFRKVVEKRPPIVFIHPYELDEERYPDYFFNELKGKPLKTHLRVHFMRLNRKKVSGKLGKLLSKFQFAPMADILRDELNENRESISVIQLNRDKMGEPVK
jgi:polysaccharide deacetylase family protein (PEP-CTERM system associated)